MWVSRNWASWKLQFYLLMLCCMCLLRYPDSLFHYAVHLATSSQCCLFCCLASLDVLLRRAPLVLTRPLRSGDHVLCGVVTATNPFPMFLLNYPLKSSTQSCQGSSKSLWIVLVRVILSLNAYLISSALLLGLSFDFAEIRCKGCS
jgi:hypothetical protein